MAVIAFSDEARTVRELAPVGGGHDLRRHIALLHPGGSTNLDGGLQLGLDALGGCGAEGRTPRRVILLTDGIANRGVREPRAIVHRARPALDAGIDLTTIGLGHDVQNDLLGELARGGRGGFHYVADAADIDKVFVREAQALHDTAAARETVTAGLDRALTRYPRMADADVGNVFRMVVQHARTVCAGLPGREDRPTPWWR